MQLCVMHVVDEPLPGLKLIQLAIHTDSRGHFVEMFRAEDYAALDIGPMVQDNRSRSVRGVVRGLHYQLRHPQGKLVTVAHGALMDVAVDIRVGSPTFGRAVWVELSATNGRQLWIPPGFAHGMCSLTDEVDLLYKCTDVWHPDDSFGVVWDDPDLGIPWGITDPTLSVVDAGWPRLCDLSEDRLPRWKGR